LSPQNGVGAAHSAFVAHCTHLFSMHAGADAGQSPLARHVTQSPLATLQNGVAPLHPVFDVQPLLQRRSPLQIGADAGHSAFDRHCTHTPRKHDGAAAPQSPLVRQLMHCFVVGLQNGRGAAHCVSSMQPTHSPEAVSQRGASPPQLVAVQAARHV
jgi:hypothetical protein